MNRRIILALVLALTLTAVRPLQAAPQPPADVTLTWTSTQTVRLTWTQHSAATQVCLSTNNPGYTLLGCMPTAPGVQSVTLRASGVDAWQAVRPGQEVYLSEMDARDLLGVYGPVNVPERPAWRQWLPLIGQ